MKITIGCLFYLSLSSVKYLLLTLYLMHTEIYLLADKLSIGNMEQNGSPALSPMQANEDGIDGLGSQIQGNNDDVEEDDPFLKRRYVVLLVLLYI